MRWFLHPGSVVPCQKQIQIVEWWANWPVNRMYPSKVRETINPNFHTLKVEEVPSQILQSPKLTEVPINLFSIGTQAGRPYIDYKEEYHMLDLQQCRSYQILVSTRVVIALYNYERDLLLSSFPTEVKKLNLKTN